MPGFLFNPNGESAVSVCLETNRPPPNLLAALTSAWPNLAR
jgi:hypothetical protein